VRGTQKRLVIVLLSVLVTTSLLLPSRMNAAADSSSGQPGTRDTLWENRTFWRWSYFDPNARCETEAILTRVSTGAYWYVERKLIDQGLNYTTEQMDVVAPAFDNQVMPRLHSAFGYEPLPPDDIDGDSRITVLIYDSFSTSYFDPRNELPATIDPTSNQREMVYVRHVAEPARLLSIVAHEVSHLIQWNYRHYSDADWVDEGLAWTASVVAGFPDYFVADRYLNDTRVALAEDRGATHLFVTYLMEHYGGATLTRALTQNSENGFPRVESTLRQLGYNTKVGDVFEDWIVANVVNERTTAGARYQYGNFTGHAKLTFQVSGYPWSFAIDHLGNGGAAYVRMADLPGASLRVDQNASVMGLSVVLLVRRGDDLQILRGQRAVEGGAIDFKAVPQADALTLAIAYLDENQGLNASTEVTMRLTMTSGSDVVGAVIAIGAVATLVLGVVLGLRLFRRRRHGKFRSGKPGAWENDANH